MKVKTDEEMLAEGQFYWDYSKGEATPEQIDRFISTKITDLNIEKGME